MSKSNAFESLFLNHIFLNAAIPNVGDTTGLPAAATAGSLYISLHTADPGEAGSQTTSEATYTGYARVAVARTSSGWVASSAGSPITNAAIIVWPISTGGSNTILYIGIGTSPSGAGTLLYSQGLQPTPGTSSLPVTTGITPQIPIGSLQIGED